MKILLIRYHDKANINSREIKNVIAGMGVWPPLGLLYLGAILRKHGYAVEILDVLARRLNSAEARKAIIGARADLVGITSTTPEIRGVMEAAHWAKETGARVVIGGPHTGIYPAETVSSPDVDFAVRGDGERPLLALVNALSSGTADFSKIPGLIYKDKGAVYQNNPYVEMDLESLPVPEWSLINLPAYSRADALKPMATMLTGRGCPYRCGFCYRDLNTMKMRFRDPVAVVDEMEYLVKNFGVKEIIFCNDTLTLQRDNIMSICDEILNRDIKILWQGATRVDTVDPEMLKLMKRAGCKQLKFGIESGNAEILRLMNKGVDRDKTRQVFSWCRELKIRTGAYFILGYIDENEKTIQETIDFAKELNPDFAMFYAGIPLPNTSYHELAVSRKRIDSDYWHDYVLGRRNDRIPYCIDNMDRWVQHAFRQFYGRPSFIMRKFFNPQVWLSAVRNPKLLLGIFFPRNYESG